VKAFRDVVAAPSRAPSASSPTNKDTALGFVVDANGLNPYQAERLEGAITVKVNGKIYDAKVSAAHKQHDVASAENRADRPDTGAFANSKSMLVGSWVAVPRSGRGPGGDRRYQVSPRATCRAAVEPLAVPNPNAGYLGVQFDMDALGVRVQLVVPKTPAEKVGLKKRRRDSGAAGQDGRRARRVPGSDAKAEARRCRDAQDQARREELELKPQLDKRPTNAADISEQHGQQALQPANGLPDHPAARFRGGAGGLWRPGGGLAGRVLGSTSAVRGELKAGPCRPRCCGRC